jgi:hypothetical protein
MKRLLHLDEREYHETDALSASGMVEILRSPAHYAWARANPRESPEMSKGSAIHRAVFEPARFAATYHRASATDGRTKEYKAEAEAARLSGKILLKPLDYDDCLHIADIVRDNELASSLLSEMGTAETSFLWQESFEDALGDIAPVDFKARMDFIGGRGIVDLKSCADARPEAFQRHVFDMRYDVQAAWYTRTMIAWQQFSGISAPDCDFWWIAVEQKAPYGLLVYKAGIETLRWGNLGVEQAIFAYRRCVNRGFWPSYTQREAFEVNPPAWWVKQNSIA